MPKEIKIKIVDHYHKMYKYVQEVLGDDIKLIEAENPDFIIYGPYGSGLEHYKYDSCIKICWAGEGIIPDFNECDYGIGSFPMSCVENRYFQIPYCAPGEDLKNRERMGEEVLNRKFCNFIYSNPNRGEGAILRRRFCEELMKYKPVDCPGAVLHNMEGNILAREVPGWGKSKEKFVKNYKFTIAFENVMQHGMVSEKIITSFRGYSLPIYWGAPNVNDIYCEESFLNLSDIGSVDRMVEEVVRIDSDDKLYLSMINSTPVSSSYNWEWRIELREWLRNVFENGYQLNKDPLGCDCGNKSARKIISLSTNPIYVLGEKKKQFLERISNHYDSKH